MKRVIFLLTILSVCLSASAVTNFTYYWTVNLAGDTATVVRMRANYDTIKNWTGRLVDTLNTKVPRWSSVLRNHDSTHTYMKIDTIRSFPNIDSLFGAPCYFKGRMVIDTLAGTRISSTTGIFDTMYCSEITGDSIKLGSGSILRQYQHSAMACFLNDSTSETYRKTINGHYTRIGNQVTLEIPALLDTIAKSCRIMIWGTFTPDTIQSWVCPIDSSDTNIMGVAIYNNQNVSWFGDTYGYITLYTINGKEIKGSGRTGLPYRMSFTYQLKAGVQ